MSFWATTWAFEQETGPSGAKFVLVALASFADQEGFAYPTQERLAAMTNQGARTVRRHLEELEAAALVERLHRRSTTNGRFKGDLYRLKAPDEALWQGRRPREASQAPGGQNGRPPAAKMAARPAAKIAARVDKAVNEPVKEEVNRKKPPLCVSPPGGPDERKRGTRLKRDWRPSEQERDYARERGFYEERIEHEAAVFRDYWISKAGQGAYKVDWEATWRVWCRRASDYGRRRPRDRSEGRERAMLAGIARAAED